MASQNISSAEFPNRSCVYTKTGLYIVPSFTVVWSFLFFPLCFLVLHTGFQRRRQNKHSTISHADFFTYNALIFEIFSYCGNVMYSVASLQFNYELIRYANSMLFLVYPGLLSLHVLTCMERYIAVVYPIVYLSLKKQKWVWIRNVIVFVIWVFCVAWSVVVFFRESPFILLTMLGTSASIISFCSVQVLHTLRNPSPSEGHGVSHLKRRAFYTMSTILSILMLWLTWSIFIIVAGEANLMDPDLICRFNKATCWLEMPRSLVLSLLFLHQARKQLPKC